MQTHSPREITQLLVAWGDGGQAALDELNPLVHEEFPRLAHRFMGGERTGHTLQTSVNEAYIRLIDWKNVVASRAHFFAVWAQLMRTILVEFARSRGYQSAAVGHWRSRSVKPLRVGRQRT